jgi:hypothetical protein
MVNKLKGAMLTYYWFSVIVDFKGTKPVSDEEREVKYVFN